MKKFLIYGVAAVGLGIALSACAETTTGKVVSADANHMVVQQKDGTQMTLKTTEGTSYHKKKAMKHGKKHHAKHQAQPMVVVDDTVEVIYTPSGNDLVVEEVTVWEE